jgi:hypothetical protein
VSDLFAFDLEDGLASGECPVCFALAVHMRRWIDAFWREGRQSPEARKRFYAGGGFCARHAWQLHELVTAGGESGAAVTDLYGHLAEQDAEALAGLVTGRRGRRTQAATALQRRYSCAACAEESEALPRKAEFFLELLSTSNGRARYERAAAVCRPHLATLVEVAGQRDGLSRYLLEDWRLRLVELRRRLRSYDRTRDHRFKAERTVDDERSWTDVIRHYVGRAPGWTN